MLAYIRERPLLLSAIVVVLVGSAFFLALPLVVGTPTTLVFPISSSDHISSWNWTGVYKDGASKEAEVTNEIARLERMVGKERVPIYDLFLGIASQYQLLGDGARSYVYLTKAMVLDGKRGLAYLQMGQLMESLGAFATARTAYQKAVLLEPNNAIFVQAKSAFMTRHP